MTSWTDEQREHLILNWREDSDGELAEAMSTMGPAVNAYDVREARYAMGMMKPKGFHPDNARAAALRTNEIKRRTGWPAVRGTPEECSERHLEALRRALAQQAAA